MVRKSIETKSNVKRESNNTLERTIGNERVK